MTPLSRIPIDDLPEPQPYTTTRIGFIYCYETTAPVIITSNPKEVTIKLNPLAENLGMEININLTREQFDRLLERKTVKL